jgi:hypothetical protein
MIAKGSTVWLRLKNSELKQKRELKNKLELEIEELQKDVVQSNVVESIIMTDIGISGKKIEISHDSDGHVVLNIFDLIADENPYGTRWLDGRKELTDVIKFDATQTFRLIAELLSHIQSALPIERTQYSLVSMFDEIKPLDK